MTTHPEDTASRVEGARKLTKAQRWECLKRLTPLGRALRLTGAFRSLKDGDGVTLVWRWWHPLSWAMWVAFLPICGLIGERISDTVPFRLSTYWQERKEKIQWL